MIEIDLGEDVVFSVKLSGNTYELREPSVEDIDEFRETENQSSVDSVTKFLSKIGMPSEVVRKMGMSKAKKLIDGLMDELTKKK